MKKLLFLVILLIASTCACDARGYVSYDTWKDGLTFDGVDDYVSLTASPFGGVMATFTCEFWVKLLEEPTNAFNVYAEIAADLTHARNAIAIGSGGLLQIAQYDNASGPYFLRSATGFCPTNKGCFISITGGSNIFNIYKDGVLATGPLNWTYSYSTPAITQYRVGGNGNVTTKGQLRDFRIWNIVRTADEIKQNMYSRLTGLEPGLVYYLPMDSGSNQDPALPVNAFPPSSFDAGNPNTWVPVYANNSFIRASITRPTAYPITMGGWVKINHSGTYHSPMVILDGPVNYASKEFMGLEFYFDAPLGAVYMFTANDSVYLSEQTANVIPVYTWMHLTGVWESETSRRLYLNGIQITTATTNASCTISNKLSRISMDYGYLWAHIYGDNTVKNTFCYNKALTQPEILSEMQRSTPATTTGLIAYYPLNETTGSTAYDISPNHYDATITGGTRTSLTPKVKDLVTYRENGPFTSLDYQQPTTLSFDGINDFVEIPLASAVIDYPLTYSHWVQTPAAGSGLTYGTIAFMDTADYTTNYMMSELYSPAPGGAIGAYYAHANGNAVGLQATRNIPVNSWIHVAVVMENATLHRIYENGLLATASILNMPMTAPMDKIFVGRVGNSYRAGKHQDVRVWCAALTQAQIQQETHSSSAVNRTGLILDMPMKEGTGSVVTDYSGNGYNGAITGASWVTPTTNSGSIINTSYGWQRTIAPFMPPSTRSWIQPVQ